ncbi:hypothetical protein L596_011121 [Steinernema carpocapsae]|uniref:Actin-related protein 6 n=1 Tax=Steinernema carpocapsae TaxID=34508 RepID=A0A4U5NTD0_STECR|nr:hypothetical protein L596_011121 [Steinernema carpocapsae]
MVETLVIDNGAGTIKAGYARSSAPMITPNAVIKAKNERKRVFIGPEIEECKDRTSLFYMSPFQKGYLVNWDIEHQVWDRIFAADKLNVNFAECRLLLTDPNCCVPAIRDASDEILFEDYGFQAVLKIASAQAVGYPNMQIEDISNDICNLVVDSGYSFTHIVPVFQGEIIQAGIKRINLGGKQLTNQLKEWISYRQMNMLEETYVMNECKEKCCFVSQDFIGDMEKMSDKRRKEIVREYVLPDYVTTDVGAMQIPAVYGGNVNPDFANLQRIHMGVERFSVPELLFRPSDVGIPEMGIAEAIALSVSCVSEALRGRFLKNIVLVGGSVLFPGFKEQLEKELRPLVDWKYDIQIKIPSDPITHTWQTAAVSAQTEEGNSRFVTREEFREHGSTICRKQFYRLVE